MARKKAYQAFTKAIKIIPVDKLLALTRAYARSVEDKDKDYLPHPASWLLGERWEEVQISSVSKEQSPHPVQPNPLDPRLQSFVDRYGPKLGNNGFAFSFCRIREEQDRLVVETPSLFYRDRVRLYERELEQHFGKRVEVTLGSPKPTFLSQAPAASSVSESGFMDSRLKQFLEQNRRIDSSVHFAFKTTAVEERGDTVTLYNPSSFCLSKVRFYDLDLERFFGKRVEFIRGEKPLIIGLKVKEREAKAQDAQEECALVYFRSPSYGGGVKKVALGIG